MQERLQYGFEALEGALKRIGTYDADNRFAPLAETMWWIDLLDTAFFKDDGTKYDTARNEPEGQIVLGLRYARNRLTHDVMVYGMHGMEYEGGAFSRGFNKSFDIGTPTWRWRIVDDLAPDQSKKEIEALYRKLLEGKEVEPTLNNAADFLRRYRTGWVPKAT